MQNCVEIMNVSRKGMTIAVDDEEFLVSFERFPIFLDMTLKELFEVCFFDDDILEWSVADIHIPIDAFRHPENYVQKFGARPLEEAD